MTEDIDKIRRRFLWAGDRELTGGKCKVAWTTVVRPVEYGGLGIIDLDRSSRALHGFGSVGQTQSGHGMELNCRWIMRTWVVFSW